LKKERDARERKRGGKKLSGGDPGDQGDGKGVDIG